MKRLVYLLLSGALALSLAACGGNENDNANNTMATDTGATAMTDTTTTTAGSSESAELVQDAASEAQTMRADAKLQSLMQQAQGVFLIPHYGKGALIVGGRGGEGVVLANNNGQWTNPSFYNMGAISIGAQAGAAGGPIAMLLMTPKAVQAFEQQNKFSVNAESGLTIVEYSADAQATAGKGDVIVWSNMKGAFAGAAISATDINFDNDESSNYYNQPNITPQQILTGQGGITAPASAEALKQALPAPGPATSTSGTTTS